MEYACQTYGLKLKEKKISDTLVSDSLCLVGELNEEDDIRRLVNSGCINLMNLLKE